MGARAGCRNVSGTCFDERTHHGRGRFHWQPPCGPVARARRDGDGPGLLHGLLPASDEGGQRGGQRRQARLPLRRGQPAAHRPGRACSTTRRTSSIWRRRPASARAGAATSRCTPPTTSTPRSACSKPASGARLRSSSTPRARRCTATTPRSRCARRRCHTRSRRTASPSWPPSTCAISTHPTTVSRPPRCATSPCTARANAPTWRFANSSPPPPPAPHLAVFGDGLQTRDFTFVKDAVAATIAAGERGVAGTRLQHRRGLARVA